MSLWFIGTSSLDFAYAFDVHAPADIIYLYREFYFLFQCFASFTCIEKNHDIFRKINVILLQYKLIGFYLSAAASKVVYNIYIDAVWFDCVYILCTYI